MSRSSSHRLSNPQKSKSRRRISTSDEAASDSESNSDSHHSASPPPQALASTSSSSSNKNPMKTWSSSQPRASSSSRPPTKELLATLVASLGASSSRNPALDAAKKETFKNLKRTGSKANRKSSKSKRSTSASKADVKGKGKAKAVDEEPLTTFKIGGIIVLTKGVQETTVISDSDEEQGSEDSEEEEVEFKLLDSHVPSIADVSAMVQRKHAFIDTVNGIEFDRDWDFEQVEAKLASVLPTLFAWVNHPSNSAVGGMFKPKWMLLAKLRASLQVSHEERPTGVNIADYTTTSKSAFRDRRLYLTTVSKIPTRILKQWRRGKFIASNPTEIPDLEAYDGEYEIDKAPSPAPPKRKRSDSSLSLFLPSSSDDEKPSTKRLRTTRAMTAATAEIINNTQAGGAGPSSYAFGHSDLISDASIQEADVIMESNLTAQTPTPPSTQVDLPSALTLNVSFDNLSFGNPWSFDSHNVKF